ncbi:MAG: tRNA uridine(34) 5-carboxymethylaminomethyl modification radical SAM/GNAT enzyme Elp3 [Coriobacteriales bacterium]|nr:tRNA uridine(34) 5-carboxymethylaminomethyl modification radical SAM/GNAT enzyme Elp3 [Coriobacteriales bacterium]
MEKALLEIVEAIRAGNRTLDAAWLEKLVRRHNRAAHDGMRRVAKRRLLPFYLGVKARDPKRWESWNIDPATEEALLRLLKMKPRRTASGVATITVITKPWPCSSDCLYCPNDVRMPKSYLANEPACQRAERNYFDPYLQVRSRLVALSEMGHVIDKIELIVLGGTWNDYPQEYRLWFVTELFRALNEFGARRVGDGSASSAFDGPESRDRRYQACGFTYNVDELQQATHDLQSAVDAGTCTYNQAIAQLNARESWRLATAWQTATFEDLRAQHKANETAAHRVVGLCIETRPDLITTQSARDMRLMGCTKVQMGIQSLNQDVLVANKRNVTIAQIERAFAVLRQFGFKIQIHFMANLLGSSVQRDRSDYQRLVSDPRFLPDEVKLYPCCLVQSSRLGQCYEQGLWRPYTEEELMGLLVDDVLVTPAYVRISRMIRDISTTDIVAGNKKTNLRQMVEDRVAKSGGTSREIRHREVATADVDLSQLRMDCVRYATTTSDELFLQWITPQDSIAGFLRLSLPHVGTEAMIREVHVYGRVARIHASQEGAAQHAGLGRRLVEEACSRAESAGYDAINVISSVGTRQYYRSLGFQDEELYQRRTLRATGSASGPYAPGPHGPGPYSIESENTHA